MGCYRVMQRLLPRWQLRDCVFSLAPCGIPISRNTSFDNDLFFDHIVVKPESTNGNSLTIDQLDRSLLAILRSHSCKPNSRPEEQRVKCNLFLRGSWRDGFVKLRETGRLRQIVNDALDTWPTLDPLPWPTRMEKHRFNRPTLLIAQLHLRDVVQGANRDPDLNKNHHDTELSAQRRMPRYVFAHDVALQWDRPFFQSATNPQIRRTREPSISRRPEANARIASGSASHSSSKTRAASESGVSSSSTGTTFCRMIGP